MLAAQFKAGKTTLRDNYIRSLAHGDNFLGDPTYYVNATSGAIVVLDLEMSANQLDDGLRDQRIRRDDKIIPIPMRGAASAFNILDPERRSIWAKRFKSMSVEVIVLDCLRPLLDALGLDEHKDAGRLLVDVLSVQPYERLKREDYAAIRRWKWHLLALLDSIPKAVCQ